MKGGKRREFKVRTFESYWVSKNVLPFAKSPKFDYKSFVNFFSSHLSTIQIYSVMVNYLFSLLSEYEIMQRKPHSKQHSLNNIANLASIQVYHNISPFIRIFMTKQGGRSGRFFMEFRPVSIYFHGK